MSPITLSSILPVPSAKRTVSIVVGTGFTILRHLGHWNIFYSWWIVARLQVGQAIYYFFSFISAIDTRISEYSMQSILSATSFISATVLLVYLISLKFVYLYFFHCFPSVPKSSAIAFSSSNSFNLGAW